MKSFKLETNAEIYLKNHSSGCPYLVQLIYYSIHIFSANHKENESTSQLSDIYYLKLATKSTNVLRLKRARSICLSWWSSLAAMWQQQQLLAMCSSEWAGARVSVEGWTQARKVPSDPQKRRFPKLNSVVYRSALRRHPWWPKAFLGRSQSRAVLSSLNSWFSVRHPKTSSYWTFKVKSEEEE